MKGMGTGNFNLKNLDLKPERKVEVITVWKNTNSYVYVRKTMGKGENASIAD